MLTARRELPDRLVRGSRGMGSFDCVSVRSAKGNFAQDDRFMEVL